MLVPSSSRTPEIRDMANKILTRVLEVSKSEGLDKYQLGLTEICFCANMLACLDNLRTTRLNHCATVIQKNLKAKYYRRKYLEARIAILLIQSVTRRHLAQKRTQEIRKIKAATTIQRVWRSQKERQSFNALRSYVVLIQAVAKGFLRRREIMDTQYRRKVVIVQSLWRGKCARRRYEKIRQAVASSNTVSQGDHENDRFAKLPADWRTQLQRIKSIEVLKDCQDFCYTVRHPVTFIDVRPDQDALEQSGGPDTIPTMDRRLKQVKFILEDGWEKEKSFETPKIVLQVSRRVHLAELTAIYEAEKAKPQKRGQPSARQRFVDLLFPYTIKNKSKKATKGEKANKGKQGRKGKKGRKVSDQKDEQMSEQEARKQADGTFDYWIRIGKPLCEMSRRYGLPVLLVLPKEVTEKR